MIRVTRHRVLLAVLVLFLAGVGCVAWTLAGLPPVKYYLRYGLDPYCEPTGEKVTYEGVEFVEIGPGIFLMGSDHLAEGGNWLGKVCAPLGLPWGKHPKPSWEMPVHWVEFRRGYWIATTEITNAQYERFRPRHVRGEQSRGDETPVVRVSWKDAKTYCEWLSEISERRIRLPSEAEWECACRGGRVDRPGHRDDGEILPFYGDFNECAPGSAIPVSGTSPNDWEIHGMLRNVAEWCEDTSHRGYFGSPADGSPWIEEEEMTGEGVRPRVVRGGSWRTPEERRRSATRWAYPETLPNLAIGFRPAFSNPEDE